MVVHATQPYVLTCSDDLSIKLWDYESWTEVNCYDDHEHYIMDLTLNPKDTNAFASASLDKTIKIWTIGTNSHFSLNGHEAGVNCVDYCHMADKPYLVSGGDDCQVKIWDYLTKQCIFTFKNHEEDITSVSFHPELPLIFSCGEDGLVNIWNSATLKLEQSLKYGLERAWSVSCLKESNYVAIGYDDATVVVKVGSENPVVSFNNGRVLWAKQGEVQLTNLKTIKSELKDGEEISVPPKDLGTSEIFSQQVKFSPNGRYFTLASDSDYVIYSTHKFVNTGFGAAVNFEWSNGQDYATRSADGTIKLFKNFTEDKSFQTDYENSDLFGGKLIGVSGPDFISFYDWENFQMVRRIDVSPPKNVYWSESGDYVILAFEDTFYLMKFNESETIQALASGTIPDDGIESSFTYVGQFDEEIISGKWIPGDVFVFTNNGNLKYLVGDKIISHTIIDKKMFILGYVPQLNRLFMVNKSNKITSYELLTSVIQFQRTVVSGNPDMAMIDSIPETHHSKVAKFLEREGYNEFAFNITPDIDHKFDLAIGLNRLHEAFEITQKQQDGKEKYRRIGDISLKYGDFDLAERCFKEGDDLNSLYLLYTR